MVLGNFRKEAAEEWRDKAGHDCDGSSVFADFHDPQPKSHQPDVPQSNFH